MFVLSCPNWQCYKSGWHGLFTAGLDNVPRCYTTKFIQFRTCIGYIGVIVLVDNRKNKLAKPYKVQKPLGTGSQGTELKIQKEQDAWETKVD